MTSAARPTWAPAAGGHSLRDTNRAPTLQFSSRDLTSHTKLKFRQAGQNAPTELQTLDKQALKEKLAQAELEYKEKQNKRKRGVEELIEEQQEQKRLQNLDADDSDDDDEEEDDSDSSESEEDEDDDEAELMRELEKIRRERKEENERIEKEKQEEEERKREEAALTGNPLLNLSSASKDFTVKRRWDDDVIFKNQAKGEEKPKKRFINDMLRSDFHRKFMNKCKRLHGII
ncbi:hypothetical protein HK098_000024 [Nowakowskiella sp. JEL0407]|nr:hypothetical protein HK098_000024 [Nowakowskiella sp. JEL0407]